MSLDVHVRNHVDMWNQLAADYRKEFLNFTISEGESHLDIKQRHNELLRKVTLPGGAIDITDRLVTLLNAFPTKTKSNSVLRRCRIWRHNGWGVPPPLYRPD